MTTKHAKKSKRKNRTTEVRTDKKDPNKVRGKAPSRRNPHALDALLNRPAGPSDTRKQRTKRQRGVPRGNTKHKKDLRRERYASAARVATMYLLSRKSNELIRLKYNNLGDFGGTDPIQDSWILEVAGPYEAMQEIMPILKKHKFRWNPSSRSWSLDATLYVYNNRKRQNFWNAARRNQKAAWPLLKAKVKEINDRLLAEDRGPKKTRKEWLKDIDRDARIGERMKEMGIDVEYFWPNRYSVDEATVWLRGDTFDIKDTLKKHGFRWGSGRNGKGWYIPMREYEAVIKGLVADLARLKPRPAEPDGPGVFSAMSRSDFADFVAKAAQRDMEFNEWYDGEVSLAQVKRDYMKRLRSMTPADQQKAMQSWQAGGLPTLRRG